jgi:hypothetical protein
MSAKSKTKGRTFEYKVRDLFTETFDSQFERVPLSGALSYLKGDVYAPWLPDFPWCIEAKHHKEVPWNNLLTAKSSLLLDFWDQTVREAEVMKKHPLLIYKWDRSKLFCCWDDDVIQLEEYVEVNAFKRKFKMALLDHWLVEAKKQYKKPN